jgi:hypothetical protein
MTDRYWRCNHEFEKNGRTWVCECDHFDGAAMGIEPHAPHRHFASDHDHRRMVYEGDEPVGFAHARAMAAHGLEKR